MKLQFIRMSYAYDDVTAKGALVMCDMTFILAIKQES